MDINLPLILVIASFIGVLVFLWDEFLLKKMRTEGESAPTWIKEVRSFTPIILLVLVIRSFVVEPFQIPSASMEPGLENGDFILVNKFTYGIRLPVIRTKIIDNNSPERGDVLVFFPPNDDRYFIKRVVGLPGDLVEYKDKQLSINGEAKAQKLESSDPYIFATDNLQLAKGKLIRDDAGKPLYRVIETKRELYTESFSDSEQHRIALQKDCGMPCSTEFSYTVPEGQYFVMGDNRDNSHDSRYFGFVAEERIVGRAFAIWMHWKSWTSLPSFSKVGTIE